MHTVVLKRTDAAGNGLRGARYRQEATIGADGGVGYHRPEEILDTLSAYCTWPAGRIVLSHNVRVSDHGAGKRFYKNKE